MSKIKNIQEVFESWLNADSDSRKVINMFLSYCEAVNISDGYKVMILDNISDKIQEEDLQQELKSTAEAIRIEKGFVEC